MCTNFKANTNLKVGTTSFIHTVLIKTVSHLDTVPAAYCSNSFWFLFFWGVGVVDIGDGGVEVGDCVDVVAYFAGVVGFNVVGVVGVGVVGV